MGNLKDLQTHKENILLAEVAAWLHDAGKLHLGHQAKWLRDKGKSGYNHTRFGPGRSKQFLEKFTSFLQKVHIMCAQATFEEIVRDHHKRVYGNCNVANNAVCLIQRVDWLDSEYDRSGIINRGTQAPFVQPTSSGFGVFSVFGYAMHLYELDEHSETIRRRQVDCSDNNKDVLTSLLCSLKNYLAQSNFASLDQQRRDFLKIIRFIFNKAAGDTRYSVNDIALWEHSWSVSILAKSFVAWGVLHNWRWDSEIKDSVSLSNIVKQHARFTRWFRPQLLPLRIDGLAYLAQSNNIPDLLARRALLTQIYDALQDILEWEFPLAGEVYRDENGPVFLTFLRDEIGQDPIPLSELQLPTDSSGTHVLREAYLRALQTPKQSLEEYLRQAVVELSQGDLTLPPEIPLFTYTQKSTKAAGEKSLGDLLADEQTQGLWLQAHAKTLQDAWQDTKEICSVCGFRPLGFGAEDDNNREKAISRKMCGICLERRVDRAKTWAQGVHKSSQTRFWNSRPETVWLDEVADANGRLALIVGYFPLEHWLDGTLVESLAMFKRSSAASGATNRQVQVTDETGQTHNVVLGPKPVSYSRLRRIWETTRRFWQDVAPTDAPPQELRDFCNSNGLNLEDLWEGTLSLEESLVGEVIGKAGPRLLFYGAWRPHRQGESPGPYHVYELRLGRVKIGVLWDPERQGLITLENLVYIAKQLGHRPPKPGSRENEQEVEERESLHRWAAEVVRQEIQGQRLAIEEPTGYGGRNREWGTIDVQEVELLHQPYVSVVPILAEPRTFMALVPADKAIDVVRAIKAKYEREMGKVRNRLPLHLGIVFADAHQPLRTILDAGRRMLRSEFANGRIGEKVDSQLLRWTVAKVKRFGASGNPNEIRGWRALRLLKRRDLLQEGANQFRVTQIVVLKHPISGQHVTWYVPAVMGDGQTEDHWYPYVFWRQDKDGKTDPGNAIQPRTCYYQAPNPFDPDQDGNPQSGWLVHSGEFTEGDVIYFTPATFDFIWLDHGGTRFAIAYDQSGRRRGTLRRPYLLDELDDLVACWEMLKQGLGTRQIHQVRNLIETKRAEWFETPEASLKDATFEAFCRGVLTNAEWKPDYEPDLARLTHWAVTGLLADAVELFYHIMKQRPVGEEET